MAFDAILPCDSSLQYGEGGGGGREGGGNRQQLAQKKSPVPGTHEFSKGVPTGGCLQQRTVQALQLYFKGDV